MKSSYDVRAQKFVELFFPYLMTCLRALPRKMRIVDETVYQFNKHYGRKVYVAKGLTRIAFITSDYVVKVDYNPDYTFGDSEHELYLYEQAKHDGYDYLFAAIHKHTYQGLIYYVMPLVKGIHETSCIDAWHYMTDEENNWCYSKGLIDLHSGNYGITRNGIKIFDYAACDMSC